MNHLNINRHTTNGEITRFCNDNPQWNRKVMTAHARHERRLKRNEHKYSKPRM